MDPVILFFVFGVVAGLLQAPLRLPKAGYEMISIVLLLAIGLKAGLDMSKQPVWQVLPQIIAAIVMGCVITFIAYFILSYKFVRADAAGIAAHYGSVSVGTFAVVRSYLENKSVYFEQHMAVMVVALEIPAIIIGVTLAKAKSRTRLNWGRLAHEVLTGKGVALLVGGLIVGWISGSEGVNRLAPLFIDMFPAILALFLLEMGLIAAARLSALKKRAIFLISFAILMPMFAATLGALTGMALGLSMGGTVILATLASSASYIAVPAAMRVSVPESNLSLSLTASVGVTFPFNVIIGIPIYYHVISSVYG